MLNEIFHIVMRMNKILSIYSPCNAIADFGSLFKQNTMDKVTTKGTKYALYSDLYLYLRLNNIAIIEYHTDDAKTIVIDPFSSK